MEYHPLVEKIKTLLTERSCWFETFEHEPVRTSEEAAKVRSGYVLHQGAKALIVKAKKNADGVFVMLVIPGDSRFDGEKVRKLLGTKELRFATEDEVSEITQGVVVGGVPPFGNLFNLEVIVDSKLLENEKIIFNAGDRRFSISMKSADYINLVKPKIADII